MQHRSVKVLYLSARNYSFYLFRLNKEVSLKRTFSLFYFFLKSYLTIIIKYRGRCKTSTATNMELFATLHNSRKPLSNIKKMFRCCEDSMYASETGYSSLNVMNRGRPCRMNSLLGTLSHLISQE